MIRFKHCAAALAVATAAWAPLAHADAIITGADPEAILDVVRGYGSGQLESDSRGDPKIVGRIDGIKYYVYFYGCVDNRGCTSVQFVAGWKGSERYTQSKMNKWNREKRMGTAYLTEKGSARLKLPVTTKFGITRANFDETVRLWKVVMKSFQKEVAGF